MLARKQIDANKLAEAEQTLRAFYNENRLDTEVFGENEANACTGRIIARAAAAPATQRTALVLVMLASFRQSNSKSEQRVDPEPTARKIRS